MEERFLQYIYKNIDYALQNIREAGDHEGVERGVEYLEIQLEELKGFISTKNQA